MVVVSGCHGKTCVCTMRGSAAVCVLYLLEKIEQTFLTRNVYFNRQIAHTSSISTMYWHSLKFWHARARVRAMAQSVAISK